MSYYDDDCQECRRLDRALGKERDRATTAEARVAELEGALTAWREQDERRIAEIQEVTRERDEARAAHATLLANHTAAIAGADAEIVRLRALLKPFAEEAVEWGEYHDSNLRVMTGVGTADCGLCNATESGITLGDLRRARAATASAASEPQPTDTTNGKENGDGN